MTTELAAVSGGVLYTYEPPPSEEYRLIGVL